MSQNNAGRASLSRVEAGAAATAARARKSPLRIHRQERQGGRRPMPEDKVGLEDPFVYEIVGPDHPLVVSGQRLADDEMVILIKQAINAAGVTRRDMQEYVGSDEGALFENKNQAYNLEYGLRERGTITYECAYRWSIILNKRLVIRLEDPPQQGG